MKWACKVDDLGEGERFHNIEIDPVCFDAFSEALLKPIFKQYRDD